MQKNNFGHTTVPVPRNASQIGLSLLMVKSRQLVHITRNSEPCNSIKFSVPARRCSSSIFCVITTSFFPSAFSLFFEVIYSKYYKHRLLITLKYIPNKRVLVYFVLESTYILWQLQLIVAVYPILTQKHCTLRTSGMILPSMEPNIFRMLFSIKNKKIMML